MKNNYFERTWKVIKGLGVILGLFVDIWGLWKIFTQGEIVFNFPGLSINIDPSGFGITILLFSTIILFSLTFDIETTSFRIPNVAIMNHNQRLLYFGTLILAIVFTLSGLCLIGGLPGITVVD